MRTLFLSIVGLGFVVTAVPAQAQLAPGDLVINEVMINPQFPVLNDADAEWIEVRNNSGVEVDLLGLEITDNFGSHFIASSVVVGPGDLAVLARSAIDNGLGSFDYVYGNDLQLSNSGDEVNIFDGATLISHMDYASGGSQGDRNGGSRSLICPSFDPAVRANWSNDTTNEYFTDNFGTPGEANDVGPINPGSGVCRTLSPGDIVVNEFMANPSAVFDSKGEWLELRNTTGDDINLFGLEIGDDDFDDFIVEEHLIIEAGGFALFVRSNDPLINGGLPDGYQWEDFALANSVDEIVLTDVFATVPEIDRVEYNSSVTAAGKSAAILCDAPGFQSFDGSTYGDGDFGTPGEVNQPDRDGDGIPDPCDACQDEDPGDFDVNGDGCIDSPAELTGSYEACLTDVLASVDAMLLDTGLTKKVRKELEKVSKELEKALDELAEGDIDKAVDKAGKAVGHLTHAERRGLDVDDLINQLVDCSFAFVCGLIAHLETELLDDKDAKKLGKAIKHKGHAEDKADKGDVKKVMKELKKSAKDLEKILD